LLAAAALCSVLFASLRTAEAIGRDGEKAAGDSSTPGTSSAAEAYGKLPLQFEANRGQTDERVRFVSRGDGYVMFLTGDEAVLALGRGVAPDSAKASDEKQGYSVLRMKLAGASPSPKVKGLEELSGKVNYFVGGDSSEWRTNVPVYGRVHYSAVYPGIDLVYYGNQRQLEYDFQVAPGADPRAIKIKFEGVERAEVDREDGSLTLHVGSDELRMKRPVIYQTADDGSRKEIEGGYRVKGREVEFNVGRYDAGKPLVIDPVLSYSTFLGIQNNFSPVSGASLALDSSGNAYITGAAASLTFPAPGVKLIPQGSGSSHVFVTKLNASGNALVYTSYIGGFSDEIGLGVALDSSGTAYVTGKTSSADFPTTADALRTNDDLIKSTDGGATWQRSNAGLQNRPVTRMWADPSSASVLYAITFNGLYKTNDGGATWNLLNTGLNSPGNTSASALAIAPSNHSILYAGSGGSTTKVVKSTDGGTTWTTPANSGLGSLSISGLGVDPTNPNVVYAGSSFSVVKTTDGGATWTQVNTGITFGGVSSFVFDPANSSVIYALGGGTGGVFKTTNGGGNWTRSNTGIESNTFVNALFMDPSNSSTLYAGTSSGVCKTTNGAGDWTPMNTGLTNVFVRSLVYDPNAPSTFYAGTTKSGIFKSTNSGAAWTQVHSGLGSATVLSLAVSASSQVYAGIDVLASGGNPDTDAFFFKLSPAGDSLVYSTYLGGIGNDEGDGIAVDSSGNAYVAGQTASADFPVAGPRASSLHGPNDAFVTKFNAAGTSFLFSTLVGGAQTETGHSVALDAAGNAYVCGESGSADFPVTPGAFSTNLVITPPFNAGSDGYVFKIDAAGSALSYATFLGGNGEDRATDIAVDSSGNAYVTGSTNSSNFPLLNAAVTTAPGGFFSNFSGYATKLNSTGSALVYSTYLGSGFSMSVALDSTGAAYLTGGTSSSSFPLTPDTLKTHSPLFRTSNSGASWDNVNFGLAPGNVLGNPGVFHDIVADPVTRGVLYAASDDGVYKSTNGGRTWTRSSNGLVSLRVNTLAIDPKTPATLYVGVSPIDFNPQAKVFKSTDGGANWNPLASTNSFQFVGVIAVDPVTPSNVYAYNGFGIIKSPDGGASWGAPGSNSPSAVASIVVDPSNPSVVYAADNTGVFKSTNGGASWSPANNGLPNPVGVARVAIDFAHTSTLYASTTAGVFKSTDGAASWTLSLQSVAQSRLLAVDPSDTSTVYAYVGESIGGFSVTTALYRTTDGGATWVKLNGMPRITLGTLVVDPFTRTNLYVTINTFTETDTDAFLMKLAPAGNSIAYSTLLGGTTGTSSNSGNSDQGSAVAVDAQGAAYVAGVSSTSDFPTTLGSFLPYNRGSSDVFVSKVVTVLSIGGVVTNASNVPQQGVKITLHSSPVMTTQLTGTDGTYLFTNLPVSASYFVGASKTGATLTPPRHDFFNLTTNQTANFTLGAGVASHKISGRITEPNGSPVSGISVLLSGSQFELTTTDANGNYSFTAPDGGSYVVTTGALVFSFNPSSPTVNNLSSDQTVNFTAMRQDIMVNNTNDAGGNSLREAITLANATPGKDRITFNIPGAGVHTITLNTVLPDIVEPVSIDASTQPGYTGFPLVELSGSNISTFTGGPGLNITGGDSLVRALVINGFGGSGIVLSGGGNNHIDGCYIGLDATGTVKRSNGGNGVSIQNSSSNVVGGAAPAQGNVVSANGGDGVSINGADNRVIGNFIGTDVTGTQKFDNLGSGNGWGVRVGDFNPQTSTNNVVGGTEPSAGNLISGNQAGGVLAAGAGTVVQGNRIGTNAAGTGKLPNGVGVKSTGANIVVGGNSIAARNVISGNGTGAQLETFFLNASVSFKGNYVGTDPTGNIAVGNVVGVSAAGRGVVVGGAGPGEGNLISGSEGPGIALGGSGVTVKGNLIGTDASGASALGNGTGIDFESSQCVVGGAESGARNVISGNSFGISIGGTVSFGGTSNVIRGNIIGLNAAGNAPIPNTFYGVNLIDGSDNTFGGDAPGEGNTIAFNGAAGVRVNSFAFNNSFRGNSIFSNARLGIDLIDLTTGEEGLTRNDTGDADDGANHLQNFPLVASFGNAGGSINVKGTLNSKPSTQFKIDFYSNAACDASGNGEGARPLGNTQVTTDAAGNASFDVTLAGQLAQGRVVTATATDPQGNTSEFSPCDSAAAVGSVEFAAVRFNVLEDVGSAVIRVARRGGSRGTLAVNYSTGGGTATAGADYTPASGTLTFAEGETSKTFLVPIANDGVAEPEETVNLSLSGALDLESFGANMRATLHIFDADTPVVIGVDGLDIRDIPLAEGDLGTSNRPVALRLSAATGRTISVDFSTLGDTTVGVATPGLDFVPVSGTVTFNPGEETRDINIPVIGDTIDEFNEILLLNLANPSGATLDFQELTLSITDDDAPPQLFVTDVTVVEGAGAKALFSVRLSQFSGKPVTVGFVTADGTAAAGSDYTATTGPITFAPGQTVKTVEVPILTDAAAEPDETFFINVSVAPSNQTRVTVADGQGQATIVDSGSSSAASLVQFSASAFTVNETAGQTQITVTRAGNTSGAATVDYKTVSQSASERSDFTASLGTLRFAAGETQKTFTVLVTDDRFLEGAETLDLVLSNPTGVALGGPSAATLTIVSDDTADGPSPVREDSFDTEFFVRQHYHDFLSREPDSAGLAFWKNEIDSCGTGIGAAQCREVKKINVSAAFFLSIEFQETGYLVYRTYKAAYGDTTSPNVPGTVPVVRLQEFLPDSQRIGLGVQVGIGDWQAQLEANKQAYAVEFVQRQRFLDAYPLSMTPAQFVDKLNQNSGGVLSQSERDMAVANLAASADQTQGRAAALRTVAEDSDMRNNEKNRAFVLMQYFGYLRRNPNDPQDTDFRGWKFWLDKLNDNGGNFVRAEMVKAFLSSDEYRKRFGL
jgi:photosystem II stability/assembly factor-like uncharacterized protein